MPSLPYKISDGSYPGCTEKKDETPHFYAHGATACRDCGHTRPANTPDSDSGSGSSGGSSGGHSSYTITVEKSSRGEVTSSRARAPKGSTVTLTVTPDSGCTLDALTVTDAVGTVSRSPRRAVSTPSPRLAGP